VPMLLGLLSKKVNNLGALWGFACGLSAGLLLFFFGPEDLDMEITLFVITFTVTLVVLLFVSWLKPMGEGEKTRVESCHQRLNTPIQPSEKAEWADGKPIKVFSPFRVVGVSIVLIGLMMLIPLPWLYGTAAFGLDLFFSIVLVVVGAASWFLHTDAEPPRDKA